MTPAVLLKPYEDSRLGGDRAHVEHVPAGVAEPPPFRDDQTTPPSPRQFRRILSDRGWSSTITLLKRWHKKDPGAPVVQNQFGFARVEDL